MIIIFHNKFHIMFKILNKDIERNKITQRFLSFSVDSPNDPSQPPRLGM